MFCLTFPRWKLLKCCQNQESQMKFKVLDMSCGHCTASIKTAITALDKDAMIDIDLDTKTVGVESRKTAAKIKDALDRIGFPATALAVSDQI
jgi:copper chaperone